jgi:hypothetical protein
MHTKYCRREECLNYIFSDRTCEADPKMDEKIQKFQPVNCDCFIRKIIKL